MDNVIKYVRNRGAAALSGSKNGSNPYQDLDGGQISGIGRIKRDSDDIFGDFETTATSIDDVQGTTTTTSASNDNNATTSRSASVSGRTFTVDEAVEKIGFGRFQVKLSFLTGLAWMADAMEMMVLSILAPALHCDWLLNEWQKALITTVLDLTFHQLNFSAQIEPPVYFEKVVFCGMMLSGTIWGKLCDSYGRKACLILCTLFTFYFGALSALAPIFIWLLILRGLVGFGIGGAPQAVTLYAEFLPSKQRARAVVFSNFFWSAGACFEVVLAVLVMPTLGWRWLLAFSSLPLLVFAVFCVWLPESARFHLTCNRPDLALETLKTIAKENNTTLPEGTLAAVSGNDLRRGNFSELLSKEHRVTSIMLWFIWFCNAFSYYGIVLLTTELFQIGNACKAAEANRENIEPFCYLKCLKTQDYIDLLWTTIAEFPGLIITLLIIEVIGRKKTMAVNFIVFSLFVYLINICTTRSVLIVFLFIARCFISGAFQAAYVYTPEYYPTNIRAVGLGTCSTMARTGAIITPFIAQVLLKVSPNAAISIYGTVAFLGAIVALLLPVETKGRDLKEAGYDQIVH